MHTYTVGGICMQEHYFPCHMLPATSIILLLHVAGYSACIQSNLHSRVFRPNLVPIHIIYSYWNIPTTATSLQRNNGHLSTLKQPPLSSLSTTVRPPLYYGHLSTTVTCLHVCPMATSLQQYGHLSTITSLQQPSLYDDLSMMPVNSSPRLPL